MRMSSIARNYVDSYGAFHLSTMNRWLHYVGIPLLVIALLGFASRLILVGNPAAPPFRLDVAFVFLVANSVWYFTLDRKLGAYTLALGLVAYFVGQQLPLAWLYAFLVVGVVVHVVGHRCCERNSPAFFSNLRSILVAPLWLLDRWFRSKGAEPSRQSVVG